MQSKLNDWYIKSYFKDHKLLATFHILQPQAEGTGHTTLQHATGCTPKVQAIVRCSMHRLHATGDQLWVGDVVHRSKVTCHRLQATSDLFIVAQIHFLQ